MKIQEISFFKIPEIVFAHEYATGQYQPNFATREQFLEITYMERGDVVKICKDEQVSVPNGSVVISTFEQPFSYVATSFHKHYTVGVRYQRGEGSVLRFPTIVSNGEVCGSILALVKLMIHNQFEGTNCHFENLSLLFRIFSILHAYCGQEKKHNPYVKKIKSYIIENISQKIYVDEVASFLGLSVGYISRLFKEIEGLSIVDYINKVKMQLVQDIMLSKKITLKKAGESVGIFDENYLSRMFKKYNHISAKEIKEV